MNIENLFYFLIGTIKLPSLNYIWSFDEKFYFLIGTIKRFKIKKVVRGLIIFHFFIGRNYKTQCKLKIG
ncbi:hypothetical protein AL713_10825 [Clostridium botulinum]|nr:hypothetical protein AL713_10825 [Clostridium botulinum]